VVTISITNNISIKFTSKYPFENLDTNPSSDKDFISKYLEYDHMNLLLSINGD
jgi:hypothetical protein